MQRRQIYSPLIQNQANYIGEEVARFPSSLLLSHLQQVDAHEDGQQHDDHRYGTTWSLLLPSLAVRQELGVLLESFRGSTHRHTRQQGESRSIRRQAMESKRKCVGRDYLDCANQKRLRDSFRVLRVTSIAEGLLGVFASVFQDDLVACGVLVEVVGDVVHLGTAYKQ